MKMNTHEKWMKTDEKEQIGSRGIKKIVERMMKTSLWTY